MIVLPSLARRIREDPLELDGLLAHTVARILGKATPELTTMLRAIILTFRYFSIGTGAYLQRQIDCDRLSGDALRSLHRGLPIDLTYAIIGWRPVKCPQPMPALPTEDILKNQKLERLSPVETGRVHSMHL